MQQTTLSLFFNSNFVGCKLRTFISPNAIVMLCLRDRQTPWGSAGCDLRAPGTVVTNVKWNPITEQSTGLPIRHAQSLLRSHDK